MIGYQRPPLPQLVFRDENGAVIPYGRRWAAVDWDGPADTYSVTAHPERFTPFVAVARAIIEHLTATYDVSRTDTTYRDGATRIRLVPKLAGTAPLEFTFRSPSQVGVTAGLTTDVAWFCQCDHCDEDLLVVIQTLENEVSAVVGGEFREWLNDPEQGYDGDDLFSAYQFWTADGVDRGGSSMVNDRDAVELRRRFSDVPAQWTRWPLR